ncbi:TetR/AcrR family transcriptional regulator [Reichenbachiella carrageenanivorans]|uniref:TetR/AcrR family transcriptional regulator n=1 Tax=Reichenbachiella carrageenanivorans TaxID=2979869 RepID=A0ABY6CWH0_9BACT|nr:TetR/AcrR family transcriptional regulator [Reichenbachiella carrageenanivorans]UXX77689.1 TetR/AcrR family transcriptional regulator [Reichenbachiella carrageenanivorans]
MRDRKQAIFQSALELINDYGFHGMSMGQLAKHADVAAGTIYHYFKSKEEMICVLYATHIEQVQVRLEQANDPTLAYKDRFYAIWWAMYDYHIEHSYVLRFYEQFVNSPYFKDVKSNPVLELFEDFLEEGMAAGLITKSRSDILSSLMIGNTISALKMKFYKNLNLSKLEINSIIDLLWKGLSA